MELQTSIVLFIVSTIIIGIAGTMLAKEADRLADITGLGEALFGAVFLGGITSLPGIITSVVAAYNGHPQLAISNAIGGIAAQTLFLSIADISYRKINLEHAAASFANLMQGVLLLGLLALILLGISGPDTTFFHIHPISFLLILFYILGTKMISKAKDYPMWLPRMTRQTVEDVPDKENIQPRYPYLIYIKFIVLAAIVTVAGYFVARTGMVISDKTNLSEGFVGMLLTAIATSLPELVVSIAAVRQKALTLAVGNIIGGNSFDILFVAFADIAYNDGSILHAVSQNQIFIISLTMLLTATLILGLLHREKQGIGKIGWESLLIIVFYLAGNLWLFFA
ncbi:sodium:calcium antiporter [Marinilabilia salmonicolor]|uniref:sodium:calcium antiporter n=1 Tax=Marinilabilia salmonicolor TaxID=989 RepID=UPI00029A78D3|nr:sodium:calcium antiporter [Marinilabilia salmonicolor]